MGIELARKGLSFPPSSWAHPPPPRRPPHQWPGVFFGPLQIHSPLLSAYSRFGRLIKWTSATDPLVFRLQLGLADGRKELCKERETDIQSQGCLPVGLLRPPEQPRAPLLAFPTAPSLPSYFRCLDPGW